MPSCNRRGGCNAECLFSLLCDGRVEEIRVALPKCKNVNLNLGSTGGTLLHKAAAAGSYEVVKLLLGDPRVDVRAKDVGGGSALQLAVYEGQVEMVKLFLAHPRVDVNARDNEGLSVLAVALSHADVVKLLLEDPRLNVNAKDNLGGSVLMLAAVEGHFDAVKLLLEDPRLDREHLEASSCAGSNCSPMLDRLARSWQCRGRNDLMDILSAHRRKEGKKDTGTKSAADAKPIHVQGAVALGDSCWNCGKQGNLRTCAACTKALYCDKSCQKEHWGQHKSFCKMTKKELVKERAGKPSVI